MYFGRLSLLLPFLAIWASSLAALYIHPAFWVLFVVLLLATVAWRMRGWKSRD